MFPDPLYGKMERLRSSKDSFINRNPTLTMQKSHSWSLSNGRRNPLPASFSEHGLLREHDFHIWNANWPMKSEAKMAAYGGQFCTSVLVPYAGLYISFSLPRDFLHFLKIFLIENTQKTCL